MLARIADFTISTLLCDRSHNEEVTGSVSKKNHHGVVVLVEFVKRCRLDLTAIDLQIALANKNLLFARQRSASSLAIEQLSNSLFKGQSYHQLAITDEMFLIG